MADIEEIKRNLRISQMAHYACAESFQRKHNVIGGMAVILTTVVSSLTFFDAHLFGSASKYAIAILGITAAMIVAIQTFSRYLEKFEAHRSAAVDYGNLHKRLVYGQADDLTVILSNWEDVSSKSPVTPSKFRDLSKKKYEG